MVAAAPMCWSLATDLPILMTSQVNFSETANAGTAGVEEAFVIYRPTGQIVWALVDGADHDEITLRIDGVDYDLLG